MSEPVGQPDPCERRLGRLKGAAVAGKFERDRDIFRRGHCRDQVKRLEHDADMPASQARQPVLVKHPEIVSGKFDTPGARPFEPGQHHQEARFARAGRPQQRDGFARHDRQRNAAQDLDRSGGARQAQANVVERDEG